MNIRKILKEELYRYYIKESLSSILYHFTSIHSLINILEKDIFKLSDVSSGWTNSNKEKQINNGYKYYISFSRTFNSSYNMKAKLPVRIHMNGDMLNYNYKGTQANYYDNIQDSESEDRLLSNKPELNNISKYITRVDIAKDKNLKYTLDMLYDNIDDNMKKIIYVYRNYNDFIKGNNNCYNLYNDYDEIIKMVNERPIFKIGV